MRSFRRLTYVAFVFGAFMALSLFAPTSTFAACTVASCNPVFARDAGLTQTVSVLQQQSLASFSPPDLYVGYQANCSAGSTPYVQYCSDAWNNSGLFNYCNGNKVSTDGVGFRTIGGKTYWVGKVPGSDYNNNFAFYPQSDNRRLHNIKTNLFDSGTQLCAQDAVLPVTYLTETCGMTANVNRASNGSYSVPVTVTTTQLIPGKDYKLIFANPKTLDVLAVGTKFTVDNNHTAQTLGFQGLNVSAGTYHVCVVANEVNDVTECASADQSCIINVQLDATAPTSTPAFNTPVPVVTPGIYQSAEFNLCDQAADDADKLKCQQCVGSAQTNPDGTPAEGNIVNPETAGFWTAFGCVKTSKEGIVQNIIQIGLGLAGGFVLLSIMYGAFLLTTSSGDSKRVQEGQEMISSAVMGLIFVIFSIMILQFIGVSILRIPGFGGP